MSYTQIADLTHTNTQFTKVPVMILPETNTMIADLVDSRNCCIYDVSYNSDGEDTSNISWIDEVVCGEKIAYQNDDPSEI